jgi:hypothetical protein
MPTTFPCLREFKSEALSLYLPWNTVHGDTEKSLQMKNAECQLDMYMSSCGKGSVRLTCIEGLKIGSGKGMCQAPQICVAGTALYSTTAVVIRLACIWLGKTNHWFQWREKETRAHARTHTHTHTDTHTHMHTYRHTHTHTHTHTERERESVCKRHQVEDREGAV